MTAHRQPCILDVMARHHQPLAWGVIARHRQPYDLHRFISSAAHRQPYDLLARNPVLTHRLSGAELTTDLDIERHEPAQ